LNYILQQQHGWKVAVIENEFGEVGIDDALVQKRFASDEEIFEMNNGGSCGMSILNCWLRHAYPSMLQHPEPFV
jgi:G3E family GTPase